MSRIVEFPTREGKRIKAALSEPEGRGAGVVLFHEWWGLNDDMAGLADRFAAEGFVALAVDLYGGRSTKDAVEAMQLANDLSTPDALEIAQGAADFLDAHARSTRKLGVTGFCLGGAMALAAACNVSGVGAVVPFYGLPRPEYADWSKAKAPILGHYAEEDAHVTPERVKAAHAAATAAGASFRLCFYPAGHAFMRASDPAAYHEESAKLAWTRTVEFLKKEIG